MLNFFGNHGSTSEREEAARESRKSSGWAQLQKHLATNEGLRILDIGPTSAININYITSLGHSIYMANLVDEAAKPEYMVAGEDSEAKHFDVERFVKSNLDFAGRMFDVVTFWDTADYLPAPLLAPVIDRIHEVMLPGGVLLGFFHSKVNAGEVRFSRYHLTPTDAIDIQRTGAHPILHVYNNRQIEKLLHAFSGYRFFLAKDNLSEVLATR
ncbi:methyltransferase domain-containing protein [Granulicella aggregans]|jgi:SAM-dependent methyltransferase|uniref:methyltransferase domain-containing protein n=1 Tax=Granulicella aggregans TaxID=474949 RepID=UPI0021E0170D|nr:class I SAM-dependent methyltransferase [Granulicella aggregans]